MTTMSCSGFLDQHGIWNNGFDCSSPRVCCGPDTDRYCCVPSTSAAVASFESPNEFVPHPSKTFLPEKWFVLQVCTVGIFLAMALLIFVLICQCLTSIRRSKHRQQQRTSISQLPIPATSPLLFEHHRSLSNRISTISSTPSDARSRCTETSVIMNTPLNLYPNGNSRESTASSSYYMFPSEFEHLCK